ncbi:hypothetical protein [Pseudomonas monsensis]
MKKDWMIWLCCTLLFLAGVTWGRIWLKTDFFAVSDIHDLFEIFSSAATVIAVIFAAYSVNNWRSQIKVQADHELARKLAVSLLKYKDSIQIAHSDAQFCVNHSIIGFEGLPPDLLMDVADGFVVRMKESTDQRAELLGVLLEVRALWGDDLPNSLDALFNTCNEFHKCVRLFAVASRPSAKFEVQESYKTKIIEIGEEYVRKGWEEGKVRFMANELSQRAEELIQAKLLS